MKGEPHLLGGDRLLHAREGRVQGGGRGVLAGKPAPVPQARGPSRRRARFPASPTVPRPGCHHGDRGRRPGKFQDSVDRKAEPGGGSGPDHGVRFLPGLGHLLPAWPTRSCAVIKSRSPGLNCLKKTEPRRPGLGQPLNPSEDDLSACTPRRVRLPLPFLGACCVLASLFLFQASARLTGQAPPVTGCLPGASPALVCGHACTLAVVQTKNAKHLQLF